MTGGSLDRARRVQQRMLPRLPDLPGVELHAHYAPCEAIGGDFYDCVRAAPGALALIVGDVAGHGLDAALVMAAAKKSMQVHSQGRLSPREVLGVVAHDLAPELPPGIFFTAMHAVLDLQSGSLKLGRAGHPDLLHLRPGREPALLAHRPNGAAIGMAPPDKVAALLEEPELQLEPGDTVVLYTDGLEEAMNEAREQYGDARMRARLAEWAELPPDALVTALLDDVAAHRGSAAPNDDITLLVVRWTGAAAAPVEIAGNLPRTADAFVGRDAQSTALDTALAKEGAVVTLTGVGGMGKTRSAIEAARRLGATDAIPGGVWFADLREAHSPGGVAYAVAQAFGLPLTQQGTPPVEAVAELLRSRPPLLLVCDNFEQVVPFAAETVGAWRAVAPHVRFLVTSREPLGLDAGTGVESRSEIALGPLAPKAARALLVDRAGPEVDPCNPAITSIVERLDGIPLALELAAAQLRRVPAGEVLSLLTRKFETLPGLEGAIGVGFDEVSPAAQSVLQQLTVFRGGATFEAALRVIECDGTLLDLLQELSRAQLVRTIVRHGRTRFDLLPTLREFAERRWNDAPASARDGLVNRFVAHWAGYFAEWGERTRGPAAGDALDRLESEVDNGLTAVRLAAEAGDGVAAAHVATALDGVLGMRGPTPPRIPTLERALGACPESLSPLEHMRLRTQLALARERSGDWEGALAEAQAATAVAESLGDALPPFPRWAAYRQLAGLNIFRGDYPPGLAAIEKAQALVEPAGSPIAVADTAHMRALVPMLQGTPQIGMEMLRAAEPHMRRLGCPRTNARYTETRATAHGQLGELEEAERWFQEASELTRELRDWWSMARVLTNISLVKRKQGDLAGATESLEEAEAWLQLLGNRHGLAAARMLRSGILLAQDRPADAADVVSPAVQLFHAAGDRRNEAQALLMQGCGLLGLPDATSKKSARDGLRRALALLDESGATAPTARFEILAWLAHAESACGDPNDARRRAAEAIDLAEGEGIGRDHPDPDVAAAWVQLDPLLGPG